MCRLNLLHKEFYINLNEICLCGEHFVCMSRRDMPVYPGDVIICRRSCAESGFRLFAMHFLLHDVTFNIHWWCQAPPCGGKSRRPKCTQTLIMILFLFIKRYSFTLCKELISPNAYLCISTRSVTKLSGNVTRLTATTAILTRMCR